MLRDTWNLTAGLSWTTLLWRLPRRASERQQPDSQPSQSGSTPQATNQATYKPTNYCSKRASQWVSQSISQSVHHIASRSVSQSVSQSVRQPTSQPANKRITPSQPTKGCVAIGAFCFFIAQHVIRRNRTAIRYSVKKRNTVNGIPLRCEIR